MTSARRILLLDACCLLNLYATRQLREIALMSRFQFGIVNHVLFREALYIRVPAATGNRETAESLDLKPLIRERVIEELRLESPAEVSTFIDFSVRMDDGEAETGAIAFHRGYAIATDDRKARRVLEEMAPAVPLVSTLELVKEWAQSVSASVPQIQEALRSMETSASYLPGRRDSRFSWWKSVMNR